KTRRGTSEWTSNYRLAVGELGHSRAAKPSENIPALAREFARYYGELFGKPGVRLLRRLSGRFSKKKRPSFFTGDVVKDRCVLTAAHCLPDGDPGLSRAVPAKS